MGGEEAEGMAGVHDEGLFVGHLAEVFHREAVLGPVLEDGAVTAVGNQLVGVLGDGGVEVVLDHQHYRGGLAGTGGVLVDRAGVHVVARA